LEALEEDIVNLSKLSRLIKRELKKDSEGAIRAALRKFSAEIRGHMLEREKAIKKILKDSNIDLKDNLNTLISRKPLRMQTKLSITFDDIFVYVVDRLWNHGNSLRNDLWSDPCEGCGLIIIKSPPEVEETPGVVAYLTSALAEQNINVVEFVSCYTFTVLVVKKDDIVRTYAALRKIIE
jgi:hypothetical protein